MKRDRVILLNHRTDTVSYGPERPGGGAENSGPRRFVIRSSRDLLLGLLIIVIITLLAIPHYVSARDSAQAARVVCDFNMISAASIAAYSEIGELPPNDGWGHVPGELVPYLPAGFDFQYKGVSYRWRRWCLPSGLPERPDQKVLLGVQVRTDDERVLNRIVSVYRGRIAQLKEKQITLVIL